MPFNRGVYLYEVLRLVSPQPWLHSTLQQKILLSPPKGLRPSEGKVGARVSRLLELVLAIRHGLSSGFSELIGEGGKGRFLRGSRFVLHILHKYRTGIQLFSRETWIFILGNGWISGYPPPLPSIGISDLAENRDVIYGGQQLRGKILSRKDLSPIGRFLFLSLIHI